MKYTFIVILIAVIFLASCKKALEPPTFPGNPNNELKATVSVVGEATSLHHAKGGNTLFARDTLPNGDRVLHISGSIGEYGTRSSREITIMLTNISLPGTYALTGEINGNPKQYARATYQVGDVFFSTVFELYFSDRSTNPGTVTIDLLTATDIRGSFTTSCSNAAVAGGADFARITGGFFKGGF